MQWISSKTLLEALVKVEDPFGWVPNFQARMVGRLRESLVEETWLLPWKSKSSRKFPQEEMAVAQLWNCRQESFSCCGRDCLLPARKITVPVRKNTMHDKVSNPSREDRCAAFALHLL